MSLRLIAVANAFVMLGLLPEPQTEATLAEYRPALERKGPGDVWVVEDLSFAGGIATAATALAATQRLGVGLGILPAMVRNPLFAAMEIAALSRLYPGRVLPGIGHGMQDWMAVAGARPESPLTALKEVLTCVSALLHGETVTVQGRYLHLDGAQLQFPPGAHTVAGRRAGPAFHPASRRGVRRGHPG